MLFLYTFFVDLILCFAIKISKRVNNGVVRRALVTNERRCTFFAMHTICTITVYWNFAYAINFTTVILFLCTFSTKVFANLRDIYIG